MAADSREEAVEEDVRHKGHERDVEVWRVNVVAGREEGVLECTTGGGGGTRGGGAEPGLMRKGEEEDAEL